MKTAAEISAAIIAGKFTNEDFNTMIEAFNFARRKASTVVKNSFRVGQKVEFKNSRTGVMVRGTVKKIGPKNVFVTETRVDGGFPLEWRVSPGLLKAVA